MGIQNAVIPCALRVHRHALPIRLPDVQGRFRSPRRPVKGKLAHGRSIGGLAIGTSGTGGTNIAVHRRRALAPESWRMNLMLLPCEPTLPRA